MCDSNSQATWQGFFTSGFDTFNSPQVRLMWAIAGILYTPLKIHRPK